MMMIVVIVVVAVVIAMHSLQTLSCNYSTSLWLSSFSKRRSKIYKDDYMKTHAYTNSSRIDASFNGVITKSQVVHVFLHETAQAKRQRL